MGYDNLGIEKCSFTQWRDKVLYLSEWQVENSLLRDVYLIHQDLWKTFGDSDLHERPFLFRIFPERESSVLKILMLSQKEVEGEKKSKTLLLRKKKYDPRFQQGDLLRFSLRVNPVKRLSKERCRVPLVKENDLQEWLARKMEGFASAIDASVNGKHVFHFKKSKLFGKIVAVDFEGYFRVKDLEKLKVVLSSGIGPAKAFGCGLLLVGRE